MAPADLPPPPSVPEPAPAEEVSANPFLSDVCRTPWQVGDSVAGLNVDVLDQLVDVAGGSGLEPLKLLTAPRAGYGKTHLLGRVAAAAADQAVIVPVAFRSGDPLTLSTLSRRGIESLAESTATGAGPEWSRLREASSQIISLLLKQLIEQGHIACANPVQAAAVLGGSVREIFDESGQARRIGEWIMQNRESLRAPLAMHAARELPLRAEALDAWLAALTEQAIHGGIAGMAEMQDLAAADNDTGVPAWPKLLSLWRPVVLLVDHLDGFYRNPEAGVRIASMLMELVEAHRLHVLLSLNQDVWQATFGHHLPSALEDRLTASQVLLRGLTEADAESLLRLRLDQTSLSSDERAEFEKFVSVKRHFLGRPIGSVSARAFLRHCARQWDIFQSAPTVTEGGEMSAAEVAPPQPQVPETIVTGQTAGGDAEVPLLTETVRVDAAHALPALFDEQTADEVQTMAESLAEPRPALPQDELPGQPTESASGQNEAPEAPNETTALLDDPETGLNSLEDWSSGSASAPVNGHASASVPPNDAFVKLREMLARIRQPGQPAQVPPSPSPAASSTVAAPLVTPIAAIQSPFQISAGTAKPVLPSPNGASPFQVASVPSPRPSTKAAASPQDVLQGRFQALRLQLQAEAMTQPLDHSRLTDLIRLAGRRFPLVRYSEHELPGLPGRHVLYWALQGVEVVFGLAPFSDAPYWRTLSGFTAGRMTDLAAQQEREGMPAPMLKLVTFKTDREQSAWQHLQLSQLLPGVISGITDAVHLDTDGLASLYAMQRIIKESEAGVLQAEPAQVIGVLARELDFFWKRITRLA